MKRNTWQREAVTTELTDVHGFVSAQALYGRMRDAGSTISLATIYRALTDMVGEGTVDSLLKPQMKEKLTSGALSTASTVTEIVTGALLVFFTLIFLLHGGRNIYGFVTKIVPSSTRERVRDAGRAGGDVDEVQRDHAGTGGNLAIGADAADMVRIAQPVHRDTMLLRGLDRPFGVQVVGKRQIDRVDLVLLAGAA